MVNKFYFLRFRIKSKGGNPRIQTEIDFYTSNGARKLISGSRTYLRCVVDMGIGAIFGTMFSPDTDALLAVQRLVLHGWYFLV